MRYASIRSMDISNGEGCGVALFVQGCKRHCYNCFNPETWSFKEGKEWTEETEKYFLDLVDRPYIHRVSFLGGEPLADQNVNQVHSIISKIKQNFPDKKIWLYTGYSWEEIMSEECIDIYDHILCRETVERRSVISLCDVVVDGEYIDEQRDLKLEFRGSKNQRVIDVQRSLERKNVYTDSSFVRHDYSVVQLYGGG